MKPSSKPPVGYATLDMSQVPENGFPSRNLNVEQFLTELTPKQRELLKDILRMPNPLILKPEHGDQVYILSNGVQELVESYESSFDAVRNLLLIRLDEDFSDIDASPEAQLAIREGVKETIESASRREVISPFADTVLSSIPPAPVSEPPAKAEVASPWAAEASPDENRTLISKPQTSSNNEENNAVAEVVQQLAPKGVPEMTDSPWMDTEAAKDDINIYVARLTPEKKDALPDYLKVNRNNPNQVKAYAGKHGEPGFELDLELTLMAEKLGCSIDELRTAASIVLKGGHVVTENIRRKKVFINPAIDPRQQKTILSDRKKNGEVSPSQQVPKKGILARLFRRRDA